MRLKLKFGPNTEKFDKPTNGYVNGFVHFVLGKENKWHDKFSPYSVSPMHGGTLDKESGFVQFPNGGYFIVASDDKEFINDFLNGLVENPDLKLQSMPYLGFESYNLDASKYFDLIRLECVRLKRDDKEVTQEDGKFLEYLTAHCIAKLTRSGISEDDAKSIKMEPFHPERWRTSYVKMKPGTEKQSITPASTVMVVLRGKKVARAKLLNLGFGNSTGCGFGFALTKNDNS